MSALGRQLVGVVLLTIVVPWAPAPAAAAGGTDTTVVALPPDTQVAGLAVGAGGVWAVNAWGGSVLRIDPRTNHVVATIPVGHDPGALGVADADVWVANEADDTLSRIDARTRTVVATIPVVHDPVGVAIGTDAVWVVSRGSALLSPPTLSRIDPRRDTVVETIPLDGTAPIGTAAGAGSLWVASRNLGEVVRIGPLPLPGTAAATGDPPLFAAVLGAGIMLVLPTGAVLRRATRRGGDRPVPDGRLLSTLLLRQQARRQATAGESSGQRATS